MSDLKRLDETLDWYDKAQPVSPDGPFEVVYAAARAYRDLLANGQRVEWCEVHHDRPRITAPSCRIVSKLLIDPPTEECDGSATCAATEHIHGCYRSRGPATEEE